MRKSGEKEENGLLSSLAYPLLALPVALFVVLLLATRVVAGAALIAGTAAGYFLLASALPLLLTYILYPFLRSRRMFTFFAIGSLGGGAMFLLGLGSLWWLAVLPVGIAAILILDFRDARASNKEA